MNKIIWIVIAVAVIVAGAYFMLGKGEESPNTSQETNNQDTQKMSTKSSIKNLMAQGGSQKCTVKTAVENSFSEGTIYVGEGKMRGDFTSVSGGQSMKSHMITDQSNIYVWTDSMDQGFKMAANADTAGDGGNSGVNVNQEIEWDCDPWSVDSSVFSLPSGIKFMEMGGAMMQ
ncbi:hypothetical protein A3B18_02575 [Candidatus Giovannonibacteria bacterium RIFCSPLOWO2_01_FULL_46_13]|uniref:DUF4412 domain-containing protein n=1 Tax=Candidatus Giovannonibacteria bacterium RIFCSPLOWO2_01_FULL_46_13 TaxID=1798352 RepID=A0A1F5X562_9BACT|nr:MAG: hypothetical protein A3B18_02575 [Candidatus Giovannonibacteria bacterium RIFCSPLOWO2_01_FULL_46_13]